MRYSLIAALLICAPLSAQTTLLSEDFSAGFPAGWIQVHNPGNSASGWYHQATLGTMRHGDQNDADNTLITPALDFSGMSQVFLHLEGETEFAWWLHSHESGQGYGFSTIEISLDAGQTWEVLWDDVSQNDDTYRFAIDLSTYAGQSQVHIGFHYVGSYDHAWRLDRVVIDDQPILDLEVGPAWLFPGYPGESFVRCVGATPHRVVLGAYSRYGNTPTMTLFGLVSLTPPIQVLDTARADNNGTTFLEFHLPAFASGSTFYMQAVDYYTGVLSNPLTVVVP